MNRSDPDEFSDGRPAAAELPALGWMRRTRVEEELLAEVDGQLRRRRRRRKRIAFGGVAAVLGLLLLIVGKIPPVQVPVTTATIILPDRRILSDGSTIELKDGARISVDYTGSLRKVNLLSGEALFDVAKNKDRPFVVKAAGIEVRAVGTAFSVNLGSKDLKILVTEGRVAVDAGASESATAFAESRSASHTLAVVDSGNQMTLDVASAQVFAPPHVSPVSPVEMANRLSWRVPQLEFSRTPLSEAIGIINRYNRVQFVMGDPAPESVRLSGFLRADNSEGLVRLLESNFGVHAERRGGSEIVLSKAP